jgi:aryl-alcohol dehydrogenase-like predicted oxidoreductase
MEYRHLGRSGLMVSEIAYGNKELGDVVVRDPAHARSPAGRQ